MSVLNLQKPEAFEPDRRQPVLVPSTTFGDVVESSFASFKRNWNIGAKDQAMFGEIEERDSTYEKEFGESVYKSAGTFDVRKFTGRDRLPQEKIDEANNIVESFLSEKRKTDPDIFAKFKSREELTEVVKKKAIQAAATEQKVKAGASGTAAFTGGLVGSLGASFLDPINLATLPIGAGAARGILKTALIEGAINMGVETVSQPFVADWQKELGREYGLTEMAENVAVAGVFGFAFGGAIKTASKVVGLDRTAKVYGELGDMETAGAAKYLSREAHLNENAIYKADEGFEYDNFVEAVTELNSAIKEGRRVNHSKLSIDIDSMMGVDLKKVKDPILRANVEEFQDLYRGIDKDVVITEAPVAKADIKAEEVYYHGGPEGIETFRTSGEAHEMGSGVYLTASEDIAEGFGPKTYEVHVKGEIFDFDGSLDFDKSAKNWDDINEALRKHGWSQDDINSFRDSGYNNPNNPDAAKVEMWDDFHTVLKEEGFVGIEGMFDQGTQRVVFDPSNIRILGPEDIPPTRPKVSPGKKAQAVQPEAVVSRGKETINEILSDPLDVETPNIRVQKEIETLNNSPQAIKQELKDFDEVFKGREGFKFFDEELGREVSVAEIKAQFKDDADFIKAIQVCGVGS